MRVESMRLRSMPGTGVPYRALALLALFLAALTALPANADPLDPKIIPGIVFSAGRVDTRRDDTGVGSGFFLDANYTRAFVNGGTSYEQFGSSHIGNVYVGVGVSKLLQLQVGMGNEGPVARIRHDLNLTSLYDFFTGTKRSRFNRSLGNRLTFTVALENYKEEPQFDNFRIGVGLLY